MAFIFAHFQIDDYDAWKSGRFDRDPAGRKDTAKSHQIYRAVDDPGKVFVAVEFESSDEASAFRERLLGSGALDDIDVRVSPTVVELADQAEY